MKNIKRYYIGSAVAFLGRDLLVYIVSQNTRINDKAKSTLNVPRNVSVPIEFKKDIYEDQRFFFTV